MSKIKLLDKFRGENVFRESDDKKWTKLIRLDEGDFFENEEKIVLKNTDGYEFIADKSRPLYAENPEFITYRCDLATRGDDDWGMCSLLDIYKKQKNKYVLKGFNSESMHLVINAESEFSNSSKIDQNPDEPNFSKKQYFDGQELAIYFQAQMKGLFPKPKRGFVNFESHKSNSGGYLYFDKNYYLELKTTIDNCYHQGKFAESNAESDWNNFKYKIDSAENILMDDIDFSDLKIY